MPNSRAVKSIGGLLHPGPGTRTTAAAGAPSGSTSPGIATSTGSRIDGREANYVDVGEGPALVFVHGLGASWQSWLENIPEFARDHRVVAMDLPGFGVLGAARRRHLDRVLRELGLPPARRARDRGGRGGGQLDGRLHRRRDGDPPARPRAAPRRRLRRRLLAGLPARPAARAARAAVGRDRRPGADARHRRRRDAAAAALVGARDGRLPLPAPDLARSSPTRWCAARAAPTASCPRWRRWPTTRSRRSCRRSPAPTLIVWGAHDTLVPVKDAKRMEELIPGSRRVVFERTGHVAMLERPERFNRLLRDFLDRGARAARRRGRRAR